jgi:hypothetical protein
MSTHPEWHNTTPAQIDTTWDTHRLGWADLTGPDVAACQMIRTSRCVTTWRKIALACLADGADPDTLIESFIVQAMRVGWYLRDGQASAAPLEALMSEEEMEALRREIRLGSPRSAPILLGPIRPPLRRPVLPGQQEGVAE